MLFPYHMSKWLTIVKNTSIDRAMVGLLIENAFLLGQSTSGKLLFPNDRAMKMLKQMCSFIGRKGTNKSPV